MLLGAGETSCGNTRCVHHDVAPMPVPSLSTLELPFVYEEQGKTKSALVKVVLCERCVKKLMWKRQKDKEQSAVSPDSGEGSRDAGERWTSRKARRVGDSKGEEDKWEERATISGPRGLTRNFRSRSPSRHDTRFQRPS